MFPHILMIINNWNALQLSQLSDHRESDLQGAYTPVKALDRDLRESTGFLHMAYYTRRRSNRGGPDLCIACKRSAGAMLRCAALRCALLC